LMMSLWDALRMNMMISYQELVRTFLRIVHFINNTLVGRIAWILRTNIFKSRDLLVLIEKVIQCWGIRNRRGCRPAIVVCRLITVGITSMAYTVWSA
ncbi:hypothetical protein, partial [Escherichia coli]|uniref:hypothetical protein n=1 Tax=Escherichia coli TaxID=562 RepID=UPI001C00EAA7